MGAVKPAGLSTDRQTVRRTGRLGLAATVFRTAEKPVTPGRSLSIDS